LRVAPDSVGLLVTGAEVGFVEGAEVGAVVGAYELTNHIDSQSEPQAVITSSIMSLARALFINGHLANSVSLQYTSMRKEEELKLVGPLVVSVGADDGLTVLGATVLGAIVGALVDAVGVCEVGFWEGTDVITVGESVLVVGLKVW
jgi:hypothetical protein